MTAPFQYLTKDEPQIKGFTEKTTEYFHELFNEALKKQPLDFVYALVRVSGMSDAGWDPLNESIIAFQDYTEICTQAESSGNIKRLFRTKLLHYCHLIESSAPHAFLMNVLRCKAGMSYHISPFLHLARGRKFLNYVPPSLGTKKKELKKFCDQVGDNKLPALLDEIVNEKVRNSFFHSDYCMHNNQYRWTAGGPADRLTFQELAIIVEKAISFYETMFSSIEMSKKDIGLLPTFHRLPNYETLELLKDDQGLLCGFRVHFSNGHVARYLRNPEGVVAENLTFEKDGSINFFIGDTGKLTRQWWANGKLVENWDELNGIKK